MIKYNLLHIMNFKWKYFLNGNISFKKLFETRMVSGILVRYQIAIRVAEVYSEGS